MHNLKLITEFYFDIYVKELGLLRRERDSCLLYVESNDQKMGRNTQSQADRFLKYYNICYLRKSGEDFYNGCNMAKGGL